MERIVIVWTRVNMYDEKKVESKETTSKKIDMKPNIVKVSL